MILLALGAAVSAQVTVVGCPSLTGFSDGEMAMECVQCSCSEVLARVAYLRDCTDSWVNIAKAANCTWIYGTETLLDVSRSMVTF